MKKVIRWIKPDSQELLSDYCKRLTSQIDPADKIVLISISFGGIVVQEISKRIKVDKVIIIPNIKAQQSYIVNRAKEISELLQREITL